MIPQSLLDLARWTLADPRDAARQIITMDLGRDALWTGLALVAAFNTLLFTLSLQLVPPQSTMPAIFLQPLPFYVIFAGGLVLMVHGLFWTGRAIGGQGDLGDMLALIVWLQGLRAAAQAALLLVMLVSPAVAGLLSLGVGLFGLWLLLNFVAVAMRFDGLGQAATVLIVATLGALLGAVVLGSLIGLTVMGGPADV